MVFKNIIPAFVLAGLLSTTCAHAGKLLVLCDEGVDLKGCELNIRYTRFVGEMPKKIESMRIDEWNLTPEDLPQCSTQLKTYDLPEGRIESVFLANHDEYSMDFGNKDRKTHKSFEIKKDSLITIKFIKVTISPIEGVSVDTDKIIENYNKNIPRPFTSFTIRQLDS